MSDTYLITEGHLDITGQEPELIATCSPETLEGTLERVAQDLIDHGGDVTALRVWKLTKVEVRGKAFEIDLHGLVAKRPR